MSNNIDNNSNTNISGTGTQNSFNKYLKGIQNNRYCYLFSMVPDNDGDKRWISITKGLNKSIDNLTDRLNRNNDEFSIFIDIGDRIQGLNVIHFFFVYNKKDRMFRTYERYGEIKTLLLFELSETIGSDFDARYIEDKKLS